MLNFGMDKTNVAGIGELRFAVLDKDGKVASLHLSEEAAEFALYVLYPMNQGYHGVELLDKVGYRKF